MKKLLSILALSLLAGFIVVNFSAGYLNGNCKDNLFDLQVPVEQRLASSVSPTDLSIEASVLLDDRLYQTNTSALISELMASNNDSLLDEDMDSSDWIEIYNPTEAIINLDGWYLTDDSDDLRKWEFPAVEIGAGDFLVVFASGKDRQDPDDELHTNFQLRTGGEFLALVFSDGQTIAHSYNEYPSQFVDISYGISGGIGSISTDITLIPEPAAVRVLIPDSDSLGLSWTEPGFDDSAWLNGFTGVGYERSSGYEDLINLDIQDQMYGRNASCYIRVPFEIGDVSTIDRLTLRMKYEDGFVAYLNGVPIASFGVDDPEHVFWREAAIGNRPDSMAVEFEDFDITDNIGALRNGDNILAIHGLNATITSSDFLFLPVLIGTQVETLDLPTAVVEGYMFEPTPGEQNRNLRASLGPAIRSVTENPPPPVQDEDLIITAEVQETFNPISQVKLDWAVNYDLGSRWQPGEGGIDMVDDGTGADAVADDGIYTAVISSGAFEPGDMVRWYVTANDVNGIESRDPPFLLPENSPEYYGTVVKNPSVNTQLPVIEWFVENVSASERDSGTRGSVYYLGEFYDNIIIHRRGGSTAGQAKTHFKFDFNSGYRFRFDPNLPRVNEFNLNSTFSDKAYFRQNLAFEAYDWCGCPGSISFLMRAQRNGEFHGVYVFIEEPEEELLEREGFDPDGALYKSVSENRFETSDYLDKKTRRWEGRNDWYYFCNSINETFGIEKHNNIFDQVNLPLTLNYLAATIITHQNDHPHKNHYLYRDSDGSGEWFFLPWDHDLTWGSNWTGSSYHDYIYAADDQVPGKPGYIKPSHPFVGKEDCREWNYHWNRLIDALFEDATVREMYLRRLRTVMDEFLQPPGTPYDELFIEKRIDELVAQMAPDVALDYVKWANPWSWGGQGGYLRDQSFEYAVNVVKNDYLAVRRNHLFVTHNVDNVASYNIPNSYSAEIPNVQPPNPTINLGDYDYNPVSGNQDEEYIQLINPNSYAVEISGWKLSGGVEHEFLPGTVIVAGGSLYVCPSSAAFRSRATSPTGGEGRFVQGNYKGHLSSWGETINLEDKDGRLVDTLTYPGNPSDQQRYLRITEMMYHPSDPCDGGIYRSEEYEYVELKNIGTAPLSLEGVKFTEGILFDFPNIDLPAGAHIVVAKNQDAFSSRHVLPPSILVLGPYEGQLSNRGERIKLEDYTNSTILEYSYKDGWYDITDGEGFSLTLIDPVNAELDNWDQKDSWRTSAYLGGSPGADDSGFIPGPGAVVINELLANSPGNSPDWIELYNTTDAAIDISGWFLSDSGTDLTKYEIPVGTVIPPDGYIVFYEDRHFGNPGLTAPFALSGDGERVYLSSAQNGVLTGYRQEEDFGASETGVSFGRYYKQSTGNYDFVAMSENTPGSANSYPKVGPIVINEIMYNPPLPDEQSEYVELHNISAGTVNLGGWRFTDGIDFTFPDGVTVPAGGYLLVVKHPEAFMSSYPAVPVDIVYSYDGNLSNAGERLEISMVGDIRVDRVNFSDGSHPEDCPGGVDLWPVEADGAGSSLTRRVTSDYGNDPDNWSASSASPGE
jgi:hypothetical protein